MKPIDKFGNPIFSNKFNILLNNGSKLQKIKYLESVNSPNLFYKKGIDIMFFCDMRGTREVPIWQDTTPLFYFSHDKQKYLNLHKRI